MTGRKRCSRCRKWLPLDRFNRCAHAAQGVEGMCRQCRKERRVELAEQRTRPRSRVRPGEVRRVRCGKFCGVCLDMPHARDDEGCPSCGKPYEPEPPIHAVGIIRSSAGEWSRLPCYGSDEVES